MAYDPNLPCGRCAVVGRDFPLGTSKGEARRTGLLQDTRNHTDAECIKHLVDIIASLHLMLTTGE